MSIKSQLFDALQKAPVSINTQKFPELSVPATPSDVEAAIITNANCSIEIIKWLNTFKNIEVKELYGMVGMLSPSALAIASGFLQSTGDALAGTTIPEIMTLLGDEISGGGITGNIESPARREDTGPSLTLLEKAVALVPAVSKYSPFLTPLITLAVDVYKGKGRIAEEVGMVLFNHAVDLIKQIIINELYPDDEEVIDVDQTNLKRMADSLEVLEDVENIIEIEGARIWTHSKIVDGAD